MTPSIKHQRRIVAFLAGLARIGPTNAAMLSTLEPVVTILLASWWLSEALTSVALLGGGLILAAALLVFHISLAAIGICAPDNI